MIEGEIDHILVVIGIVATEILTGHVFHLVLELESVVSSFSEEYAHAVDPIIDEEQGCPKVDSVVGNCCEGRIVVGYSCAIWKHTCIVAETSYTRIYSCIEIAVIAKDVGGGSA